MHIQKKSNIYNIEYYKSIYLDVPPCLANCQEHAEVTVGYNAKRDEEYEAAQHQSVTFIGWSGGHIVPCARGHQTFWYI